MDMAKDNRTCYTCGKTYYYCPSCPSERKDPDIYTMFDSERCKKIFNILTNNFLGKIDDLQTKKSLAELNVKADEKFNDDITELVAKFVVTKEPTPAAQPVAQVKKDNKFFK